jgi:hypothetical protein
MIADYSSVPNLKFAANIWLVRQSLTYTVFTNVNVACNAAGKWLSSNFPPLDQSDSAAACHIA